MGGAAIPLGPPNIKNFLELKGPEHPNLDDPQWLKRLYFLTDLTSHMNLLNLKLQGKAQMIADLFREIQISWSKLDMWIEQIQEGDLNHFPTLRRLEPDEVIDFAELHGYLEGKIQFNNRFADLISMNFALDFYIHYVVTVIEMCVNCQPYAKSMYLCFKKN